MQKGILLLAVSAVISGLFFYFLGLYHDWYWFWVPLITIPVFFAVLFGLDLVFLLIVASFVNLDKEQKKPNRWASWEVNQTNWLIVLFSLAKVHVSGRELIPESERFLIVNNHVSDFDQMCMLQSIRNKDIVCVTKLENEHVPILGGFIHLAGYVPVDRTDPKKGLMAIRKASKLIEDDVASVAIAPEGTRSKSLELLPFHPGSFKIAYWAKCPIVVINFTNTNLIHKNFLHKRTNVYLDIIARFDYEQYKDIPSTEMADKVRSMIYTFQQENLARRQK